MTLPTGSPLYAHLRAALVAGWGVTVLDLDDDPVLHDLCQRIAALAKVPFRAVTVE